MPGYNDGVLASGQVSSLSSSAIDAIWDDAASAHTTVGTFGGDSVRRAVKTVAFTGATGLGEVGAVSLFTVTGRVLIVAIVPSCTEDLVSAGGGSLALGVTSNTALFIAATTATDIDTGEIWVDTAPDANGVALPAALKDIVLHDNDEIIGTVATGDITDGTIEVIVEWVPLSSGASVVAA